MLINENSSISILIIQLFHLIGVLINYFTLTNGKTQFLLAKLIDGVSFPVELSELFNGNEEDVFVNKIFFRMLRNAVVKSRFGCFAVSSSLASTSWSV